MLPSEIILPDRNSLRIKALSEKLIVLVKSSCFRLCVGCEFRHILQEMPGCGKNCGVRNLVDEIPDMNMPLL
jgi:hypothetical protein